MLSRTDDNRAHHGQPGVGPHRPALRGDAVPRDAARAMDRHRGPDLRLPAERRPGGGLPRPRPRVPRQRPARVAPDGRPVPGRDRPVRTGSVRLAAQRSGHAGTDGVPGLHGLGRGPSGRRRIREDPAHHVRGGGDAGPARRGGRSPAAAGTVAGPMAGCASTARGGVYRQHPGQSGGNRRLRPPHRRRHASLDLAGRRIARAPALPSPRRVGPLRARRRPGRADRPSRAGARAPGQRDPLVAVPEAEPLAPRGAVTPRDGDLRHPHQGQQRGIPDHGRAAPRPPGGPPGPLSGGRGPLLALPAPVPPDRTAHARPRRGLRGRERRGR